MVSALGPSPVRLAHSSRIVHDGPSLMSCSPSLALNGAARAWSRSGVLLWNYSSLAFFVERRCSHEIWIAWTPQLDICCSDARWQLCGVERFSSFGDLLNCQRFGADLLQQLRLR